MRHFSFHNHGSPAKFGACLGAVSNHFSMFLHRTAEGRDHLGMFQRFIISVISFLLIGAVVCCAQAPVEVSPCDLMKQPQLYDSKLVQVRDSVSIGFENFTLDSPNCGEYLRPIWLEYGHLNPTPPKLAFNYRDTRPGFLKEINGKRIVLIQDESLDLFKRRLLAVPIGRGGDILCRGVDCHLYKVNATFTGYFFAFGKDGGGWGHLGCCNLLVIQQVARVDARRTDVRIGGMFPSDSVIGCKDGASDFPVEKADAKTIAKLTSQNHEPWRLAGEQEASRAALDEAAHRWGVPLAPEMKFAGCDKAMTFNGDQSTWCHWSDAQSTQSFTIQITRFGFLRHWRAWNSVPWILTRGYGIACSIEN